MKRDKFALSLWFAIIALLSACGPGSQPVTTPSEVTRPALTDTVDVWRASSQAKQTQNAANAATRSARVTQSAIAPLTLTAQPTRTPAQTPQPTTTPTPAPDLVATARVQRVMENSQPEIIQTKTSPDGRWRAELVRYDCVPTPRDGEQAYESLHLAHVDGGVATLVAGQLQNCGGIGAGGLGIVYWSQDSRYLHYTESAHGVPDGDATAWYRSLFRYDLLSDETIDLRWGPLAPDGVTMAYPDPWQLTLHIWDLDRGEIARLPAAFLSADSPGAALYGIAWSPDGGSLVYLEAENAYAPAYESWLVQLDLSTFERTVVYQSEEGTLCCVEWQEPRQIQFLLDWEPQLLDLPQMKPSPEQPGSLWCERPDDLYETRVAITRLPGAAQSFCIVWVDSIKDATGFRVQLNYENGGERFQYIAGPHGTQWIVPFEYRPRLEESQEQFLRRNSFSVHVYALHSDGETLVGATGLHGDNFDLSSLPTATTVP